jgi:hypothetical protein
VSREKGWRLGQGGRGGKCKFWTDFVGGIDRLCVRLDVSIRERERSRTTSRNLV